MNIFSNFLILFNTAATVLGFIVPAAAAAAAAASTCKTTIVQPSQPAHNNSNAHIALQSFSYCGGTLNATAFVQNQGGETGAAVTLYYADGEGQSTPLSAISMSYTRSLDDSFELWSTSTPVYYDGITELLNVTVQTIASGQMYHETLNKPVVASGAPVPVGPLPPPQKDADVSPKGFGNDITEFLAVDITEEGLSSGLPSSQSADALEKMFRNINPDVESAARGVVVAAGTGPWQPPINLGYRYYWVRDSSLTMDMVQKLYGAATTPEGQGKYAEVLFEYAAARAKQQTDARLQTGLGEPKFYLNNTVYSEPWSRPQNDGAATAAISLISFADQYLANDGSADKVKQFIYGGDDGDGQGPVLKDLLFVASNWSSTSYDIWEAVPSPRHFYNALVSRRALRMGATFARDRMNDTRTAMVLAAAADDVTATLDQGDGQSQFWHPSRQAIMYQYGPVLRNKTSYLDSAVILALVHGYNDDGVFGWTNDQVLSTVWRLANSFVYKFPLAANISHQKSNDSGGGVLGMPIGRFPEDMYNGTGRAPNGGNPWYVTTASFAQLMYSASAEYAAAGCITVSNTSAPFFRYFAPDAGVHLGPGKTYCRGNSNGNSAGPDPDSSYQFHAVLQSLNGWGDAFMRTIKQYTPREKGPNQGRMTEQFDRTTGVQRGAADLTWSYASLLLAAQARARVRGQEAQYMAELADLGAARYL